MKKCLLFLMISLAFVSFNSCSDNELKLDKSESEEKLVLLNEMESIEIVNSKEFHNFDSLRNVFLDQIYYAIERGYVLELLKNIKVSSIETGNSEKFFNMLFDSNNKGIGYVEKLESARKELINKFPIIIDIASQQGNNGLSLQTVNNLLYNFPAIYKQRMSHGSFLFSDSKTAQQVCGSYWNQVKLFACAGLCGGATAGSAAVLCGWGCWCMLCSENSAVADAIC